MSWICSNSATNQQLFSNHSIYYQYRTIDPKTRQIYNQSLPIHTQGHQQFKDWRRIKVESVDVKAIIKLLKQNKEHFIDPLFPHNNSVLSKDHFKQNIQWARIREVIQNPVYSKEQTVQTLQKIKLNRMEFEKALVLIARSSPTLYKQILTKTLNSEGIYEFKIFRNGLITNITIDDYIPVHQGQPIFVGPVRQNQVYPILLEKAIAKACGSYQNIPQDCEQIMEMIFCGPVKKYDIEKLKQTNLLSEKIVNSIKKKYLSVLISKKDSRLKNYGLNQNQIYNLINIHLIDLEKGQETVYELMSQSKISAWNGRFSLNDQAWQKMDLSTKMKFYQQIKNNKSFFMSGQDLAKHFEELLIFQSLDTKNKQWIENISDNQFPSFTQFEALRDDNVFIRVTTPSKIRHCLILVKQTSPNNYEFVASSFQESAYKTQLSIELSKGKYVIVVYHQWFLHNTGSYYVFISSQQHINLQKGGILDGQFLAKTLINYEVQLAKMDKNYSKLYSMRIKVHQLGLAWLFLKPQESKNKSLTITIDQQKLKNENWELMQPFTDSKIVNVSTEKPLQSRLIILKKNQIEFGKKQYFPVGAFVLKQ